MTNRRLEESAAPLAAAPRERAFRLRHLVLLGLMGWFGHWIYPRAQAAFELHTLATAMADYGACMVGPTGPSAIRDNPSQFRVLLRRRLVTSDETATPFADCAELAKTVSGSPDVAHAHLSPAVEFVEFGGPKERHTTTLEQLRVSTAPLARLADSAWPLERKGYAHLVKPSSHAREAAHPVELNRPLVGIGLPGWRSLYEATWARNGNSFLATGHSSNLVIYESGDNGISWQQTSLNQPGIEQHAGRCMATESQTSFTLELRQDSVEVISLAADHNVSSARIGGTFEVLAMSCDQSYALLALEADEKRGLFICAHGGGCGPLPHQPEWIADHFDIARTGGASVVATARAGIVRVRSSRDQGQTWTPATVAFDWGSYAMTSDVKVPSRLLVYGQHLLLFGAAKPGQTYPLLISRDQGASWHTPSLPVSATSQAKALR